MLEFGLVLKQVFLFSKNFKKGEGEWNIKQVHEQVIFDESVTDRELRQNRT